MSLDQHHAASGDSGSLFDVLRARMAPEHQTASDVLDRVNAVYVESPRDGVLRNSFDRFLAYVTARQRHERRGKGNAFFITGESGAGKTDMVEHLLVNHPVLQPIAYRSKLVRPWVRVALQGPATLRVLGADILTAIGYPVKPSMRENAVWTLLPEQLRHANVFLVHIDETQHLLARGADNDVASAIKGLMNYMPWPVSFILSGKPKLNDLIVHDDQAERRSFNLMLDALDAEANRNLIVRIIKEHCEAAGLDCEGFVKTDMPERIAHAANYQFGRICEVTITGIHAAILRVAKEEREKREGTRPKETPRGKVLVPDDMSKAYRDHSHTRGHDDLNPFHVKHWDDLPPGYFVTGKEDQAA